MNRSVQYIFGDGYFGGIHFYLFLNNKSFESAADSACRTMFLDICKRHGLELDEEPSDDGRKYLETR